MVASARSTGTIATVGVVIPAHNEQQWLARCLSSVLRACQPGPGPRLPVDVLVVLDRCSDGTAGVVADYVAAGHPVRAIHSAGAGVGPARAAGVDALIARHGVDSLWICTTDADSTVPADWIDRQLAHATAGADAVAGTVEVLDWSAHPALVVRRYYARYRNVPGHLHVHGANLSFRAGTYLAAGGFGDLPGDEDVDLVRRIDLLGANLVRAADLPVITSARLHNRVPAGFGDYLTELRQLSTEQEEQEEVDDVVC